MSDRVCIRGCTQLGVHYATCPDYGMQEAFDQARATGVPDVAYEPTCRGCAPRECRDGSLICDRCFGRMRALLDDATDLLGRLRAIADPMKATVLDQVRVRASSVEPAAPVDADLLDAIAAVEVVISVWDSWGRDLAAMSNQADTIGWLGERVLDRHTPVDGIRPDWSLRDAVDQWGVERRDRDQTPYEDDDREEIVTGAAEWGDELLGRADAETLAGSARTLRRWVKSGDIAPAGTIWIAGVRTTLFRRSELLATQERLSDRQRAGLAQNRDGRTDGRPD